MDRGKTLNPDELDPGAQAATVSVVVPVYNSAGTLEDLAGRISAVLEREAARFELILVNDGSRDSSWTVIESLASRDDRIRGIDLMRNYGQHNALLAGIQAARYRLIVTLDDDLQNPPEEMPILLRALTDNPDVDVVYGVPRHPEQGRLRNLGTAFAKWSLSSAMGGLVHQVSAYRAFRTPVRSAFAGYGGPYVSIDVLLSWGTTRFAAVSVDHQPRRVGRSNYDLLRLTTHAINMLTGFAVWPLRVASIVGFGSAVFGLGALVYVLGRYLLSDGHSVAGFTFLAATVAIFAGAQLFALGVMGEYMARLHFRSMGRPPSVVRRLTTARSARLEEHAAKHL